MRVSEAGIALIKEFEGVRLEAYLCPAGIWTIGVGSTGPDVVPGLVITEEEAETRLRRDLRRFERCVTGCVAVPVTQSQFDALVSLAFNIGCAAFRKSTLVRKLNDGDDVSAAQEFIRWNRAGGVPLAGLTRRRQSEMELFLS